MDSMTEVVNKDNLKDGDGRIEVNLFFSEKRYAVGVVLPKDLTIKTAECLTESIRRAMLKKLKTLICDNIDL